jgi:hypothetical protein
MKMTLVWVVYFESGGGGYRGSNTYETHAEARAFAATVIAGGGRIRIAQERRPA